jgi:hypothetical protein
MLWIPSRIKWRLYVAASIPEPEVWRGIIICQCNAGNVTQGKPKAVFLGGEGLAETDHNRPLKILGRAIGTWKRAKIEVCTEW